MGGRPRVQDPTATSLRGARRLGGWSGRSSVVALSIAIIAATGSLGPLAASAPVAASGPARAPAITARGPVIADPFGVRPSPPPAVGVPRIPWLAPTIPQPGTPVRAFHARRFPLPPNVAWEDLFPTSRWVGPAAATGPTDASGLPMRLGVDGTLVYSPTNLGLQGLRRLEGFHRTGDRAYLASARAMAEKLRELGVWEGDRVWLPFPYDDKRARMRTPWVNALGQAVALALFSRLHRLEGRPDDLDFATGLFHSFTQLRRPVGPWVSDVDRRGNLWFEHYPDGLRGRVLNAHAYAVLALRDYWQETGSDEARRWLEGGLTTLRDEGPRFRREGTWSRYNLRNPAAHAVYHGFHVREFRALAAASGDSWFGRFADLLQADFD